MAAINVAHDRSPDLWVALRTGDGPNAWGYPGTTLCDNPDIPPGGGIHGGLHRSELATVLTLGGELFRREAAVETPCAITDLAPNMLEVLGMEVPASMAGSPLRGKMVRTPARERG